MWTMSTLPAAVPSTLVSVLSVMLYGSLLEGMGVGLCDKLSEDFLKAVSDCFLLNFGVF